MEVNEALKKLLLKDLRIQCRARGLNPGGGKEDLLERIKEHMMSTNDRWVQSSPKCQAQAHVIAQEVRDTSITSTQTCPPPSFLSPCVLVAPSSPRHSGIPMGSRPSKVTNTFQKQLHRATRQPASKTTTPAQRDRT
jgi:hypothetical protein